MTGQQHIIILEFHELQRIHDYLKISSRKKDDTLLKIKSIIMQMQDSKNRRPVCKITVDEKSTMNEVPA